MLDVMAVAEVLLGQADFSSEQKATFALLAGAHDLGKISLSFRSMLRHGQRQHFSHWELTEAWLFPELPRLADRLNGSWRPLKHLISAVAGHHGRPSGRSEEVYQRYRDQWPDEEGRLDAVTLFDAFLTLFPDASLAGLREADAKRRSWWLAGLVTAADWVASNPDWFPPLEPSLDLPAYLHRARGLAAIAVREAGLQPVPVKDGWLFPFPAEQMRAMQREASSIALRDGPMLAFIEDETGAGKTEAGLILAQRMLLSEKAKGLFFALPTMATADAMFARARGMMGRLFDCPSLTLAHGRAALSRDFRALVGRESGDEDDVTCAPWLADSRHRALLGDIGIGTIDQALLSILPSRFSTLRHWGLSSKILIVDEAHELGDPYMAEQLARLLEMHAMAGGSAILMSATLPINLRQRFAEAFERGTGREAGVDRDMAYPSLSIAGGEARRSYPAVSGKGDVAVCRLEAMADAVDVLADGAAKGAACVWVRNAVDDAIAAVEALRERGVEAKLLHARFALHDRKRIEAEVLARWGRGGQERGGVLVATQIVESSLDLDFDLMVSDLAPMAALIQRIGRLWRHMDLRPATGRPLAGPVLHLLSPDPDFATDERWLQRVLDRGAWTYPLTDQWRTADKLVRRGRISIPADLRALVEAVDGNDIAEVPAALQKAEEERFGQIYAERSRALNNVIAIAEGYATARVGSSREYPTRLGEETRTLLLARREAGGLRPWAPLSGNDEVAEREAWMLSEVSVRCRWLARFALPDQAAADVVVLKQGWPEWRREDVLVCPVEADGRISDGLRYEVDRGLTGSSPQTRG
ncbi:CRISPR-associated helicase Cas3' [Sandaracinobacter neustonicus]|uniref:CRISPR-associated helicase Cas3 n=2 Tax=Sandaracinobacter neustonicus TaxID=1715348 RepID=A0A501XW29_9SPHN|nr:CRISPR-associated helicase Cas3' [Sandaracinobacter neustonicus]